MNIYVPKDTTAPSVCQWQNLQFSRDILPLCWLEWGTVQEKFQTCFIDFGRNSVTRPVCNGQKLYKGVRRLSAQKNPGGIKPPGHYALFKGVRDSLLFQVHARLLIKEVGGAPPEGEPHRRTPPEALVGLLGLLLGDGDHNVK